MQRSAKIWKAFRLGAAFAVFAGLTAIGYLRGYDAEDRDRAKQTAVLVPHKMDDLLGPDFSAAGMQETTQSLIALVNSLHLEEVRRNVVLNPISATSGFTMLQVTTFPYKHKEIERLFNQLRKPPNG
jgi:hypothetical protein